MVNAVFIDYMGTTVDERSLEMAEIVRRICKNSSLHDPKQVQRFILDIRRRYEADGCLDACLTQDEIVDRLISDMAAQIGLPYMEQALQHNGLTPARVISADAARACKPHREIFDEALRVSGCTPNEVVHIGDSYDTDVVGAHGTGIRPVLLLRGRVRPHDNVDAADNLEQALEPAGMTYVMVYGEALAALYAEASQGCRSENILAEDHLAELFLSIADRYGCEDEKRVYYEVCHQKEGSGDPLSKFICEKVFNIRRDRDLFREYKTLKDQLDDCHQALEEKMRGLLYCACSEGSQRFPGRRLLPGHRLHSHHSPCRPERYTPGGKGYCWQQRVFPAQRQVPKSPQRISVWHLIAGFHSAEL